jgi:tetratricopeptide (TPR) repeat protein
MSKPSSVFLSFSSRDMKFANEIMAVLKYQGVDIWDYSNEIESIEAGTDIEERLKSEIRQRDVFVPMVSPNSMDLSVGRYTRLETDYAIKSGKTIIPVVLPDSPEPAQWLPPYSMLLNLLYLRFEFMDDKDFIRNLVILCQKLGAGFQPLDESHPRLPFWSFFRAEIHDIPKSNYHYGLLMSILWGFNKCFFMEEWVQAENRIGLFIRNCEYLVPDYAMFYPYIVHAVCLRHMAKYDEAEKEYLKAMESRPGYGLENIYGGLAGVYLEKEDYEKSFHWYERSLKESTAGLNGDEKFNFVVASLHAEKEVSRELSDFVLGLEPIKFGKEAKYLYNAKACLLYLKGMLHDSIGMLNAGLQANCHDENTFLFYIRSMLAIVRKSLEGSEESGKFLARFSIEPNEDSACVFLIHMVKRAVDLYYPHSKKLSRCLVELSKKRGDFEQARAFFETYILGENNSREDLMEYALLLFHLGKKHAAAEMAKKVLGMSLKQLPANHREMYFEGMAYYLLDQKESADFCYRNANLGLGYYDTCF